MSREITSVRSTQLDTLRKMDSVKISEASDAEIAKTLVTVYYLIGLRPDHYPTPEEDQFIFNYLRNKYGFRKLDEITMAFDLAINDFLDCGDVRVFDQFTIEYLVRIMRAYSYYTAKLLTEEPPKMPLKAITAPLGDDNKRSEVEYWKSKKELNFELIPLYLFNYLKDLGHIDGKDNVKTNTRAAKIRLKELRAKCNPGTREDRQLFNEFSKMFDEGVIEGKEFKIVNNIAKRLVIYEWLKANQAG
jgi:hypothetical protein